MRPIFAAVFIFCSLQDALALQKANAQDYRDIAARLDKKKATEDLLEVKLEALKWAKGDEAVKLEIKIADLKTEQKNAAEQALWMTIRAYDIIPFADNEPKFPDGVSVLLSPEKGKRMT